MKIVVILIMLFMLVGCDEVKDIACGGAGLAADKVADLAQKEGGCDPALVKADVELGLKKVLKCEAQSASEQAKASELVCAVVPGLVTMLGSEATKKWKCSTAGITAGQLVHKALGCE